MEKLILIDGNSLLNRAFYAMRLFTTKDGLPTNGVFGFVKLIFKIIDDEKPEYFAVAFDVHAPTFRHKMYTQYKGTRKPMPEELVKQVPVLKQLLKLMGIRTIELSGYEADDVIGTVSRKFDEVQTLIYTGDRDAYQLVKENVCVCFTKRGVSDLDRLTDKNFRDLVGLEPWQIVEEKALMGDSSDNIPGVHGIGGKTALELLQKYESVDGVYAHLAELTASLQKKLTAGKESAELSRTLARIDTNVPLTLSLENCRLTVPFPKEARDEFLRLEFRSLVDSRFFVADQNSGVPITEVNNINEWIALCEKAKEFSVCVKNGVWHVCTNGNEYLLRIRENFLTPGLFQEDFKRALCELFQAGRTAVSADIKTLIHRLDELNIEFNCNAEDLGLLRYLLDSNNRPIDEDELVKDYSLPKDNLAYAVKLAYGTLSRKISENANEQKLYRELELPLAFILLDVERTGVCVDADKFPSFSEKYNAELETLSEEIFRLAGERFNLNSPFQLSDILFGKLGIESKGIKKSHRGGFSTSAEVLEKLSEEYEIAKKILRYREVQKLLSTYIDGIRPLISNGKIHTTYNQTIATTGRLSSANPNLQNIPVRTDEGRELRKLFVAEKGNMLVDADYSQIELRLLAHFSGCKALCEAYRNGEDVHAATASHIFGVPLKEVTPSLRRRAKTINFGIVYGMSRFGLAKDIGCSPTEAQEYLDKYFSTHREVKDFMDETVRRAKEEGYITTILGRRRFIPELQSSNYNLRSFGERAAMNMPLQGSAADIIKIAMIRVADRLKTEKLSAKMVLQVHDELLLDSPESELDRAAKILKEEMESALKLNVPLIAEVSVGRSWYDAK